MIAVTIPDTITVLVLMEIGIRDTGVMKNTGIHILNYVKQTALSEENPNAKNWYSFWLWQFFI